MSEIDEAGDGREPESAGAFRYWMLIPVLGAAAVVVVFALGLHREDGGRTLPSPLVGKPAPQFTLEPLIAGQPEFSTADLKVPGVKLVNVWASWCVPCRAEQPKLEELAGMGITIHAINYKDRQAAAEQFLADLGNPFTLIGADRNGRAGIDWGVYGVPETFVIDGAGTIVYKHVGPIQGSDIEKKIMPAIDQAAAGG